jgi:hypothetical protein
VERLDRDVIGEGEREMAPERLGALAEIRDEMYEGSKRYTVLTVGVPVVGRALVDSTEMVELVLTVGRLVEARAAVETAETT